MWLAGHRRCFTRRKYACRQSQPSQSHRTFRYRLSSSTTPQNQSPTVFSDPVAWAWVTLMRLLLIADFTLVGRALALIPLLGMPLGIAYMSIITSYYPYE